MRGVRRRVDVQDCGDLLGLVSMKAPQATFIILLALLKSPPHMLLELLELPHPVSST